MRRPGPHGPGASRWTRIKRRMLPRGLSFTREGRVYVLVTLGVGFAAVNTGNNLLFLVLGMMLGLIIVSGILSEVTLRGVSVRRRLPGRVEEGAVFPVELTLVNGKAWSSSFSVELRDEIDGRPFRRRCFFLRAGPGEERSIAYRCELPRRGLARFGGTVVSTRFPFGLFDKTRFVEVADEVIAIPSRIRVALPPAAVSGGGGESPVGVRGAGQEFLELRDMAPGDDPRRIHWRTTARVGRRMVRETERDSRGFVEIVLDPAPSGDDREAMSRVEQDIRAAGTLVRDCAARGVTVRLVTPLGGPLEAAGGGGSEALLDHLALLDPARADAEPPPRGRGPGAVLIGPRAGAAGRSFRLAVPPPEGKAA